MGVRTRDRPSPPSPGKAAHPDDWRAWWLLGYTLQRGPEAKEAHGKLGALAAGGPRVDVPAGFCGGPRAAP